MIGLCAIFYRAQWQGFTGIGLIVRKRHTPHPARIVFTSHADYVGMLAGLLCCVENFDRTSAACERGPIGKGDPLVFVLVQKRIANGPVIRLVLPPIGMNPPRDLGRLRICKTSHGEPRAERDYPPLYTGRLTAVEKRAGFWRLIA